MPQVCGLCSKLSRSLLCLCDDRHLRKTSFYIMSIVLDGIFIIRFSIYEILNN